MKTFKQLSYSQKIRWRVRLLYLLLVAMVAYMVVISEMGGGDSRIMNSAADAYSRVILFGGMIWTVRRIVVNKRLLQYPNLLKESMLNERDERNRYIHSMSGGVVWDVLFVGILFITLTTSLFDMAAFAASRAILLLAVCVKLLAYLYYSKNA